MRGESEKQFQAVVVDVARFNGWRCYHTHDSRRSQPGFPDLVLVRDRVLFRELKTDDGNVDPEQEAWLDTLLNAGADAAVWRPRDWPRIEAELCRRPS